MKPPTRPSEILYDVCGAISLSGWFVGVYTIYAALTTGDYRTYGLWLLAIILVVATAQSVMRRLEDTHAELEGRWDLTVSIPI